MRRLITDDDEDNEEFIRKYRLFKEKYLLKESLIKQTPKQSFKKHINNLKTLIYFFVHLKKSIFFLMIVFKEFLL